MSADHTVTPQTAQATLAARHADAINAFAAIGWTTDQWVDLYQTLTQPGSTPGSGILSLWLRQPPTRLAWLDERPATLRGTRGTTADQLTPVAVLGLLNRYGRRTLTILTGIVDGATERFAATYLGPRWKADNHDVAAGAGWRYAHQIGLTEPQATGWAPTGYLNTSHHQTGNREHLAVEDRTELITQWTDRFGSTAYLYVLAGFTLEEATALLEDGTPMSEQQLRVMVALNGHTLPDGI